MEKINKENGENIFAFVILTSLGLISSIFWIFQSPLLTGIKIIFTSYNIFFLPSYLIYINSNHDEILNLEYAISSVIQNLCFWTIVGIIFIQFHLRLTLFSILIVYFTYLVFLVFLKIKNIFSMVKRVENPKKILFTLDLKRFQGLFHKKVSNFTLLIIFLTLLSVFISFNVPFVPYEDVWYHLSIVKDFVDDGILSLYSVYRGNITYHFLGAIFSICSGIDILSIGKFVGILQIPFGCLIFYVLVNKFVKNKNIVILTTIIFSLTSLGTILNFSQFWPQALAIFFGFQIIINYLTHMTQTSSNHSDIIQTKKKKKQ